MITIAAPLIVMVVLLVQGLTAANYDPVRQTISELGTGWGGTRIVSLYGLVVLICVWPPMSKRLGTSLWTVALIAALLVIGVGCIGLGETAAESGSWNSMAWRGRLHLIFAFVFVFAGIPAACLAAARALPPAWRGLRAYSLATALGCLALFVGTLTALGSSPTSQDAISHLGLIERAYVFAFLIWQCVVSTAVARSMRKDI